MTLYDEKLEDLIKRKGDLLAYRDSIMVDYNQAADINWDELETAITDLYSANDLPQPRFIRVDSPWQAAVALVVMQLIKCGNKSWRAELRDIFSGTLWQRAFDTLQKHVGKTEPGIAGDGANTVWLSEHVGLQSSNSNYVLRCDRVLRDKIDIGQFAILRSTLHKHAQIMQNEVPRPQLIRLMSMMRPNRQMMLHLFSLSENTRRQIVDTPDTVTDLQTAMEMRQGVASFDRSLKDGTLESELIDLFPDEMIETLPKKLFLTKQNSQLTHQESTEMLAAHFAKVFCNCITGIQWRFPRDEWLALNTFPLDFLDENFYDESLIRTLRSWPVLLRNNVPHIFLNNLCFLIEKPAHLRIDEEGRLHCETDAAIEYNDGFKLYSWHGVTVPPYVILSPENITVQSIEAESNTEVRRVMIEQFGDGRYLEESGAQLQSEDRYGQLFRKTLPDEDFVMVRVKNSTPEPDGTYRYYYIRVPPTMSSAHEAVAWTFGLSVDDYNPDIES